MREPYRTEGEGTWEEVGDKSEGNEAEAMGRGRGSEEEVWVSGEAVGEGCRRRVQVRGKAVEREVKVGAMRYACRVWGGRRGHAFLGHLSH